MQTQFVLEKINNEIINPNTERYNNFLNAYKKAFPGLKKEVQPEKAQKLWNDVKNLTE